MSKDKHISPADVAENLMAMNHKIDVVGSLKNMIEALEEKKNSRRWRQEEKQQISDYMAMITDYCILTDYYSIYSTNFEMFLLKDLFVYQKNHKR